MADTVRISDLDVVFISFREPNKEENYADLLSKVPWAKRVDGVVGFDNAHKAAAELAETEFFISIDGDNIVDPKFLLQTLDWSKTNRKAVHRWKARNSVNGLAYGNGGVVGWDRETCLNMMTHENAVDERARIDFCWTVPHENLHNIYSATVINSSAEQAFVAGFREGVKMSLDNGAPVSASVFAESVYPDNLKKLCVWQNIGADVEFGKHAMLGARIGCYKSVIDSADFDFEQIKDLDYCAGFLNSDFGDVDEQLELYGNTLKRRLDINIVTLDADQSAFFKYANNSYKESGVQDRE